MKSKKIEANISFPIRTKEGAWSKLHLQDDILKGKKVVIFSLPGAFTPTCSSSHLPRYEALYDTFRANGIDEVYCASVNDTFVMNEWAGHQGVEKVKMLPDGNGELTNLMGMLASKNDLGFGVRSWRYSVLIEDGVVVEHFIEPDKEGDPFEVSDADTMLNAINKDAVAPKNVTVFTKTGCPFCKEAKDLLLANNMPYAEVVLTDADRLKVLAGILGTTTVTVPQIFIEGERIGGVAEFKKLLEINHA